MQCYNLFFIKHITAGQFFIASTGYFVTEKDAFFGQIVIMLEKGGKSLDG